MVSSKTSNSGVLLSFKYPYWIEKFPVKFIRKYLKRFYWKYGEIFEF